MHQLFNVFFTSWIADGEPKLTSVFYQLGVIYLTTLAGSQSIQRLESALNDLLTAATPAGAATPVCLYKLQYEQSLTARKPENTVHGKVSTFAFPSPSLSLAFDDSCLAPVKDAWKLVMGADVPEDEYMVFQEREGVGEDDEIYD